MCLLKVEPVNGNHNNFLRLFLDDRSDLFDAIMAPLPIFVVRKIVPAKLTSVLGRLARPLGYGITNLSLASATFVRLLAGMVGESDCFHLAASSRFAFPLAIRCNPPRHPPAYLGDIVGCLSHRR